MPPSSIQEDNEFSCALEGVLYFFKLYTSDKDIRTTFSGSKFSKGGTSLQKTMGVMARGLLLGLVRHWHATTPRV